MKIDIKTIFTVISSLFIFAYPGSLHSLELTPFNTQNQSPFIQIYGLPSPGDAHLTPPGGKDFKILFDLANNSLDDSAGTERVVVDGETYRTTLVGRYGIAQGMELGVEIPYITHSGGFLDAFIESYHGAFGFPQGDRERAPRGRLLYQYQRNGINRIKVDGFGSGLGDVRLTTALQLHPKLNESPTALALRASLKLPTGETDQLHGSGSTDMALWLTASDDHKLHSGHWTLFGAAGILGMSDGKILADQQRNWVEFGTIGIGWSPLPWFGFKMQLNGHTSFFKDSDLVELNGHSAQLTVGGTFAVFSQTTVDIGVTEDLIIKTAPDVVFHIAVQSRFW
jgi:hypothetical protein